MIQDNEMKDNLLSLLEISLGKKIMETLGFSGACPPCFFNSGLRKERKISGSVYRCF